MLGLSAHLNRSAAREVCDLLREHYFRAEDATFKVFLERCQSEADSEPLTFSREKEMARLNRRLSLVRTSHLSVYSPNQNRQLWANEGLDTGIRARRIEGELVIVRLLPSSPAELAGLKIGDAVIGINGEASDVEEVQSKSGRFRIARGAKILDLAVEAGELTDDLSPTVLPLNHDVGLLTIASFLPNYFDDEAWRKKISQLSHYKSLVLDVRGNAGGSFPAMIRALSPFLCSSDQAIGRLWTSAQSRVDLPTGELTNDLNARTQIEILEHSSGVQLHPFAGYDCLRQPVIVLIDSGTSSVAEIFAEAFTHRFASEVWGEPSAGQVVMARWFPIRGFGGGDFAISIPIAGYRTARDQELEHVGLDPKKLLFYNLELALQGRDSWLIEAEKKLTANASSN